MIAAISQPSQISKSAAGANILKKAVIKGFLPGAALSVLFIGTALAQTPGLALGNGSPETAGMNNAAVNGAIPGMDAGRSVIPPSGPVPGTPRHGSINNAPVTGAFPGFAAGRLPPRIVGSTADLQRPTGGMNNAAVNGALPGMGPGRVIIPSGFFVRPLTAIQSGSANEIKT